MGMMWIILENKCNLECKITLQLVEEPAINFMKTSTVAGADEVRTAFLVLAEDIRDKMDHKVVQ
jgi:hypothetical protein